MPSHIISRSALREKTIIWNVQIFWYIYLVPDWFQVEVRPCAFVAPSDKKYQLEWVAGAGGPLLLCSRSGSVADRNFWFALDSTPLSFCRSRFRQRNALLNPFVPFLRSIDLGREASEIYQWDICCTNKFDRLTEGRCLTPKSIASCTSSLIQLPPISSLGSADIASSESAGSWSGGREFGVARAGGRDTFGGLEVAASIDMVMVKCQGKHSLLSLN